MEPTDQLDAPNRKLPESRVRRFAKRNPASRPTSIFLVNPSPFSTSPIERVGWRWLWDTLFWCVSGTIVGTVSIRDDCRRRCAGLTVPGNRPPDALRSNCRNPQKERLRQEVRGLARGERVYGARTSNIAETDL